MKNMFMALLICSISIGNLSAQEPTTKNSPKTAKMLDQHFATAAAEAGITEVELGKLGEVKATSARVKEFSKKMVSDHSKANDELRNWAKQNNITWPSLPATGKNSHKMLKEKSDIDFDKAFMKQMIEDHERTIKLFEDEARKGQNVEMRTWASHKLATLKRHLYEAQQIYKELNK
jgi:putative membrane protein